MPTTISRTMGVVFLLAFAVPVSAAPPPANENATPTAPAAANGIADEVRRLEAENRVLRDTIRHQAQEIKNLQKEVEHLRGAMAKTSSTPATDSPGAEGVISGDEITYKGKPRTAGWLEAQYAKYGENVDRDAAGKYHVARRDHSYPHREGQIGEVPPDVPEPGTERRWLPERAEVLQIIGPGQIIVRRSLLGSGIPGRTEILFFLSKIRTEEMVDGSKLASARLLYVGTYRYVSTDGVVRTIPSYVPWHPITKEEFAEAIRQGLDLEEQAAEAAKPGKESRVISRPVP